MASCNEVATFLHEVSDRTVASRLAPDDVTALTNLNLLRRISDTELQALEQRVLTIQTANAQYAQEDRQQQQLQENVVADTKRSHSILFHLEGVDKQHSTLERLQQENAALKSLDDDLLKRQQEFSQLLLDQSLLAAATKYNGDHIAITTQGRLALRDLDARLFRVGEEPFATYWNESVRIDGEIQGIADGSGRLVPPLAQALADVERGYLWAIAIGLTKSGGDPQARLNGFLDAFHRLDPSNANLENALMAAEILSTEERPLDEAVPMLESLVQEVGEMDIPSEARLGVAAILLMGQRADGTFATAPLASFLGATPSHEAAALLAIRNEPYPDLLQRFTVLREVFTGWGYSFSEDTELSAAYLAISDLPADAVAPKMSILTRGLSGYLQYPLVAAAILATIPVLEANETLNLMEKAYEILGQRTGPMSQAELISLAVRTIHGIDVRQVDAIDPTATVAPATPTGFSYAAIPPRIWLPTYIVHGWYYSTWSGIGGPHPGHVHVWGGGGFTG